MFFIIVNIAKGLEIWFSHQFAFEWIIKCKAIFALTANNLTLLHAENLNFLNRFVWCLKRCSCPALMFLCVMKRGPFVHICHRVRGWNDIQRDDNEINGVNSKQIKAPCVIINNSPVKLSVDGLIAFWFSILQKQFCQYFVQAVVLCSF